MARTGLINRPMSATSEKLRFGFDSLQNDEGITCYLDELFILGLLSVAPVTLFALTYKLPSAFIL